MQFKHVLVALLVLLAFVGTAAAADSVEIRSTLLDYDDVTTATPAYVSMLDATTWAGFYFDFDLATLTGGTEEISMKENATGYTFVMYETTPAFQKYEYTFGTIDADQLLTTPTGTADIRNLGYAIIGFFAEPYVALGNVTYSGAGGLSSAQANQIAKLVIDSDEKYLLKTGSTLELGDGYSIIVDQIDVDGNKALIGFYKDGKELNRSIITTGGNNTGIWTLESKLFNKDAIVMRLHVSSVFQGTQDSLVEIEGIWVADYLNALEVKSSDKFGKWEATGTSGSLVFETDGFRLSNGEDLDLGRGIFIKTSDNFTTNDAFYIYKEYTEAGVYEIRSTVKNVAQIGATKPTAAGVVGYFDNTNFAAFYFDLDNTAISVEELVIYLPTGSGSNGKYTVTYTMDEAAIDYEYSEWSNTSGLNQQYNITGLFGEKYVPLMKVEANGDPNGTNLSKIAKLVIDDDEKYLLKTGSTLELGEGYSLIVDQIDVDGNKALIGFYKDGKEINRSIITTGNNSSGNWILRNTVLGDSNIQTLRVHVSSVFQGTQDSLVEIDGLWLMDYQNAMELKSEDKFGILEYTSNGEFTTDDLVFNDDDSKLIANNLYLRTSDNVTGSTPTGQYYFYVEATVGEGEAGPTQPDIPDVDTPTPAPPETPEEPPEVVTPPVDNNTDDEKGWFAKNWMYILAAIVLIIIIAGVAYYFLVMKKQ